MPKPRSAQSHSVGAAHGHPGARPTATWGVARAHGAGAARVCDPRARPVQRARPNSAEPRNARRTAALLGEPTATRRRRMGDERGTGG
jgi:hypothetical protein